MTTTLSTRQHYRLPNEQRKDLMRRLKFIFANSPKQTSRLLTNPEKSKPVADWWNT